MKRAVKVILMVALAIGVGVGVAYAAYSQYEGFQATTYPDPYPNGSQTYSEFNKRGVFFSNNGSNANTIRFEEGDDAINMGTGNDILHLSTGKDAICFGSPNDNQPGVITFDGAGQGMVNVHNSNEHIRSENADTKTASQIKIRSHSVYISTHGGDFTVDLGAEF